MILNLRQEVGQIVSNHVFIVEIILIVFRITIKDGPQSLVPLLFLYSGTTISQQLFLSDLLQPVRFFRSLFCPLLFFFNCCLCVLGESLALPWSLLFVDRLLYNNFLLVPKFSLRSESFKGLFGFFFVAKDLGQLLVPMVASFLELTHWNPKFHREVVITRFRWCIQSKWLVMISPTSQAVVLTHVVLNSAMIDN